jgi:hypothetical protein
LIVVTVDQQRLQAKLGVVDGVVDDFRRRHVFNDRAQHVGQTDALFGRQQQRLLGIALQLERQLLERLIDVGIRRICNNHHTTLRIKYRFVIRKQKITISMYQYRFCSTPE